MEKNIFHVITLHKNFINELVIQFWSDMRLLEFEGKDIFQEFEINVPERILIEQRKDLDEAVEKIGFPMVLKAQVPLGGRGKAGGIKIVERESEAEKAVKELLDNEIKGHPVNYLLAEEKLDINREMYCGIVGDDKNGSPEIIISSEGGINIEEIAEKSPEKIKRKRVDPYKGLKPYQCRNLAKELGLEKDGFKAFSEVLFKLYNVFEGCDAKLSEINPLVETNDGKFLATDSKIIMDDHSLFSHPKFEKKKDRHIEDELEREGSEKGVNYVDLDGNIVVMANGAGLAMALMDLINKIGYSPAAFLDTGGGLSEKRMEDSLNLLFKKAHRDEGVKAILATIRFMISPPDAMVKGLKNALQKKNVDVPLILIVRGRKRYVDSAKDLLRDTDIEIYTDIEQGVKAIKEHISER